MSIIIGNNAKKYSGFENTIKMWVYEEMIGDRKLSEIINTEHENVRIGKAGRQRHLGIRPTVRGVVMNPVDHPHGGGEGRSPVGMPAPMSPWGKKTQGVKTRKHRKYSDKMIVKRAGKR